MPRGVLLPTPMKLFAVSRHHRRFMVRKDVRRSALIAREGWQEIPAVANGYLFEVLHQ